LPVRTPPGNSSNAADEISAELRGNDRSIYGPRLYEVLMLLTHFGSSPMAAFYRLPQFLAQQTHPSHASFAVIQGYHGTLRKIVQCGLKG